MNRRSFIKDALKTVAVALVTPTAVLRATEEKKDAAFWTTCMLVDVKNGNGRIYPRAVVEKALTEYRKEIDAGRAIGVWQDDHFVFTGRVNLDHASHVIRDAKITDAGEVRITMEGLYTPAGRLMTGFQRKNGPGSVEFRFSGCGSVSDDLVVQDDYRLISIDAVPAAEASALKA